MKLLQTPLAAMALILLTVVGCYRGRPSEKPPIHLNPNMDDQPRYNVQERNDFFADSASMRPLVEGTVARGWLREAAEGPIHTDYSDIPLEGDQIHRFYTGRVSADDPDTFVDQNPIPYSKAFLKRGQERYGIYCGVCHSETGDGLGMMMRRPQGRGLPVMPTNLHEERIVEMPDGQIFDSIVNGIRNMPSYRHQISTIDSWAIVAYVRALQLSQAAPADQLPPEDIQRATQPGEQ